MTTPLDEILAEPDDARLCPRLFDHLVAHHGGRIDVSELPEEERIVLLVCHVSGIIGNGGFRYLFEGDLKGDPDFALTRQAFEIIGARSSAQAVRDTLAIFPGSRPPRDIDKRLRFYLTRVKHWPTDQDHQFFDARQERAACLAAYIRSHAEAYRHLDGPPRSPEEPSAEDDRSGEGTDEPHPLAELSHWKRVAFAARCARRVQPLLSRFWPDIPGKYARAVLNAIELAEQSAAQQEPASGLHDAVVQAAVAAGSTLGSHPDYARGEPRSRNAHEGGITSFVAKAAQLAAETAESPPEKSASLAFDAWDFARRAAGSADDDELARTLDRVLAQVRPLPTDVAASECEEELPDQVLRGRRLFLLFAVPVVFIHSITVIAAFFGTGPINWWTSVFMPVFYLLGFYWMWKGDSWVCRILPPLMIVSGVIRILTYGYLFGRLVLHPRMPEGLAGVFLTVFGLVLWPVIVLALIDLVGGLVFLLSPSVTAFFRHQSAPAETMF